MTRPTSTAKSKPRPTSQPSPKPSTSAPRSKKKSPNAKSPNTKSPNTKSPNIGRSPKPPLSVETSQQDDDSSYNSHPYNHTPFQSGFQPTDLSTIASTVTPATLQKSRAINLEELVLFYKNQLITSERQISTLVSSISDLDPAYDELAKARSLASSNSSEVTRLQNYVTSLNSAVLTEKERSLNLSGEVERLKIVELEIKKENEELLGRRGDGGIVKEEVTFFRDCRPERVRKSQNKDHDGYDGHSRSVPGSNKNATVLSTPATAMSGRLNDPANTSRSCVLSSPRLHTPNKKKEGRTPVHHAHTAQQSGRQVLRTVYLPNERSDALVLMVESLSSQLTAHKELSKEHVHQLKEGYAAREREKTDKIEEDKMIIEDLTRRCNDVERNWRDSVRDCNDAMRKLQVLEREGAEKTVAIVGDLEKTRRAHDEDHEELVKLRKTLKSHSQVHHRNLLGQVAEREKDLHELREQYKELQDVYESKILGVEGKLASSREKYKALEERRKVEIGGFQKDTSFFKNSIRQLEHELMVRKKSEGEQPSGGRARSASSFGRQRSASTLESTLEESEGARQGSTTKQRTASIIASITNQDFDQPKQLPENESFYGGLTGQLNSDVVKLKTKVERLSKEVQQEGEILVSPSLGRSRASSMESGSGGGSLGAKMKKRDSKRIVSSEVSSARRGSYFGMYSKDEAAEEIVDATKDAIMEAWLESGLGSAGGGGGGDDDDDDEYDE